MLFNWGDIAQWGWGETDRWHLGVMVGYGNEHNNTDSVRTGYRSKGSVNGYSTGLYATGLPTMKPVTGLTRIHGYSTAGSITM